MRVVIDTNIFISGIFWTGESNKIINMWKEGRVTLISSTGTVSEVVKVLDDFKIRLPKDMIKEWSDMIISNSIMVEPMGKLDIVKDDPKDNIFIDTALTGNGNFIISQDKHLLRIKEFRGIKILSPEEFNRMCT